MAKTVRAAAGVAERYANALYELARDAGSVAAVRGELDALEAEVTASPQLAEALSRPTLTREDAGKVVAALAARMGMSPMVTKFLGVMAAKRRLPELRRVANAFRALDARANGVAAVAVTSAAPLAPAQIDALGRALAPAVGAKAEISYDVDPALIGGLVVKIGSRLIDASVASALSRLRQTMKEVR